MRVRVSRVVRPRREDVEEARRVSALARIVSDCIAGMAGCFALREREWVIGGGRLDTVLVGMMKTGGIGPKLPFFVSDCAAVLLHRTGHSLRLQVSAWPEIVPADEAAIDGDWLKMRDDCNDRLVLTGQTACSVPEVASAGVGFPC